MYCERIEVRPGCMRPSVYVVSRKCVRGAETCLYGRGGCDEYTTVWGWAVTGEPKSSSKTAARSSIAQNQRPCPYPIKCRSTAISLKA